jgi:type VI secretion system VasD/TssJ family lipoprotein
MRKVTKIILIFPFIAFLSSCSSSPKIIQPPEWEYERNAIQLHLTSDPRLNLYQKRAHSLILCVYHLKDLNGFNQLADEKDGLSKLLECSRFDPSVTYSKRLIVQPNQEVKESLDRTEGAKYVGIIAGYYSLRKDNTVRTFQIPVSLFNNPKKLKIDLYLGPQEIREIKGNKEAKEKQ